MTKGQLWQALLPELELKARQWAELDVFTSLPDNPEVDALQLLKEWQMLVLAGQDPPMEEWLRDSGYAVCGAHEYSSASDLIEELESLARNFLCGFKLGVDLAWEKMTNE